MAEGSIVIFELFFEFLYFYGFLKSSFLCWIPYKYPFWCTRTKKPTDVGDEPDSPAGDYPFRFTQSTHSDYPVNEHFWTVVALFSCI
jgi:hypothetical protein